MAQTVTWLRWLIGAAAVLMIPALGVAGPATVAGGFLHTCALMSGGGVACFSSGNEKISVRVVVLP